MYNSIKNASDGGRLTPSKVEGEAMTPPRWKVNQGQSIIEVIVAVAIFVIIASTSVMALLGSFSSSRLAEEETKATYLATEGLEATQSIRNQDWDNLTNGQHGLANAGGTWAFSGSSDVDQSGKFTRAITISDIQRDGNGNIVEEGGAIDPDFKKTVTTVSWNFTPVRQNTVQMSAYLTNWQAGRSVGSLESPVTPTPTPTPSIDCAACCQAEGYSSGACRTNQGACTENGETMVSSCNKYCTGHVCCCAP